MSITPEQLRELVRTAPERIWLQISDDADHWDEPFPYGSEVTWCQDSVQEVEVEYVRADRIADLTAQLAEEREAHAQLQSRCFDNGQPTHGSVFAEVESLRAQLAAVTRERDEARSECMEQARLNGMGGERELALKTEVESLRAQLAAAQPAGAVSDEQVERILNSPHRDVNIAYWLGRGIGSKSYQRDLVRAVLEGAKQ